ncbi:MAG: DEAD/DEAH box helicase, partial [Deltaproteobacteria bacterium]|nr:DEAD/DEAH box helicase [Deltaproteobacteria bacterium]
AYRFRRGPRGLELHRLLVRGDVEEPLVRSLVTLAREDRTGVEIAASKRDLTVEVALGQRMAGGPISPRRLPEVLRALRDAPGVCLDDAVVSVGATRDAWRACVKNEGEGFMLVVEADPAAGEVFSNGASLAGGVLAPLGQAPLSEREREVLRHGRFFPPGEARVLVAEVLPALKKKLSVVIETQRLPRGRVEAPTISVALAQRPDGALVVSPTLVYGDPPLARVDGQRLTILSQGGAVPLRDEDEERRLAARLERHYGLSVGRPRVAQDEEALELAGTLSARSPGRLVHREVLRAFRRLPGLEAQIHAEDGGVFEVDFVSGDGSASAGDSPSGRRGEGEAAAAGVVSGHAVLAAWSAGRSLMAMPGGGFAPLPEAWLQAHGQRVIDLLDARDPQSGKVVPSGRLDLAQLLDSLDHAPPPDLRRLRAILENFEALPVATLPEDLNATLRPYQNSGVDWLVFLRDAELGALLADDMGLGKTLQAICALEAPTLVVAPRSVLRNWEAELARFRPGLSVNIYHGGRRKLDATDITLTTYAILRLDADVLAARRWRVVVLDEAQQIKNPESQVAQAAFRLDARWRLALTGTPVENSLGDLWSQFHFLSRGFLGGRDDFARRYAQRIEAGDGKAAAALNRKTKPFILRREKGDVAADLPLRTEMTLRCVLSEAERSVYDAVRAAARGEVLDRLAQGGNVLAALEALLRLRQASCDVALVPGQDAALGGRTSAKLSLLLERLVASIAAGHKALVFSQWTGLLDRVEPLLASAAIDFLRLDGATRDRQAVVDAFQDDAGPPVFLISLKAGGVGLNLTAADHIFLLDPWWNPAVEAQAADRAHRIGQTRPVLIHRLVAEDTVEEQMLVLQEKKRALAAAALVGSAGEAGRLTRDDLLALLA